MLYKSLAICGRYKFDSLRSASLALGEFTAAPMILLLGQYSVGKTSLIEYLTGASIAGTRVGPEPTTDSFMAVMHGGESTMNQVIPGHAAASDPDKPFQGLKAFGAGFLDKFQVSSNNTLALRNFTLVDSPGTKFVFIFFKHRFCVSLRRCVCVCVFFTCVFLTCILGILAGGKQTSRFLTSILYHHSSLLFH